MKFPLCFEGTEETYTQTSKNLDLDTKQRRVLNVAFPGLYRLMNVLHRTLGGPDGRSGNDGEENRTEPRQSRE
jgi:hypothetical protein